MCKHFEKSIHIASYDVRNSIFTMSDLDSISNTSDIENSDVNDDSENEYVFSGEYLPYQNEPLASESESSSQDDDELDEDRLSVEILKQRYEKEVPVDKW